MASEIDINSFITTNGVPTTSLAGGYPTLRIWAVNNGVYHLIVGSPSGSGQTTDGSMVGVGDGFWSFPFTTSIGYDPTLNFLIRIDSGPSQSISERYQTTGITPDLSATDLTNISNSVWNTTLASETTVGTMGGAMNSIYSNTSSLYVSVNDITPLVELLIKYQTNRTEINVNDNQLIIYDNDCVTALRVFNLYDSTGQPSVNQITERVPVVETDGQPVCT